MRLRSVSHLSLVVIVAVTGCGGESPAEPVVSPPTAEFASMFPRNVEIGAPAFTLRIGGNNFVPGSAVHWGDSARPTTFQTAQSLTAEIPQADVESQGVFIVTVVDPAGEVASNHGTFEVRAPTPNISSLSTIESPVNQTFVLEVDGTGFYVGSVVRLGSSNLQTEFTSVTRLTASLAPENVADVGSLDVSVFNPAPGGGQSSSLQLTIIPANPSLSFLSSEGATAGRPGFDLHVFGKGFRPNSGVFWNGSSRPTTFLSHNQIIAAIAAVDVAIPGVANITVENLPPSGPAPETLTLTVRALGPAVVSSLIEIDLAANDLAFSESTGLLYASVSSSDGALGNTITAINPLTGSVTGTVFVGSEPTALALSDDGRVLWVALDGAGAVRRVDLVSLTAGLQFTLTEGFVEEIDVMPGQSETVAISQERGGGSPRFLAVHIYDNGVPRSTSTLGNPLGNTITFDDSGAFLYGHENSSSGFGFEKLEVTAGGLRRVDSNDELINSFGTRIGFAHGRLYATSGEVIDARRLALVGNLGLRGTAVKPDVKLGRVFVLQEETIDAIDLNNFQALGTISFPRVANTDPVRFQRLNLVRWGADGLAFRDGFTVYIIRTPLAEE